MSRRKSSVVAFVLLFTLTGCTGDRVEPVTQEMLVTACDSIAQQFTTALKQELMAAMQEEGAAYAVGVCSVSGPDIAAEFSRAPDLVVKRISRRARNPENAPDAYELGILSRLAATDGPPVVYEWRHGAHDSTFYYFRALRTGEFCLTCHGEKENLDSALVGTLAEFYPDDRATGYQAGDLRGALVVTVHDPSLFRAQEEQGD